MESQGHGHALGPGELGSQGHRGHSRDGTHAGATEWRDKGSILQLVGSREPGEVLTTQMT